eukprot:CAMPEP_0196661962 /NCGR_PEP_ID=MMETSP1086-20130531/46568_1 /TAXON_ID=77921 /ORGANISM="Cyanoptyche  gloeocystis , Strain SAG4.97" /LENGTH=130 /DNA_ID=CAMNT_0041997113 /DNA_START=267 /DNA_END=659 /DNA_ORIENTATION=-
MDDVASTAGSAGGSREVIHPVFVDLAREKQTALLLKLMIRGQIWLRVKLQAGLRRKLATLASVTSEAGCDNVLPGMTTAFASRRNMVKAKFGRSKSLQAVLASEAVAKKNVLPGKCRTLIDVDVVLEGHN